MKKVRIMTLSGAALLLLAGAANGGQSTQERAATAKVQIADASSNDAVALAPVALNSLSNPPDKIATAMVVDNKGSPVGAVRKVEMDTNGKPIRVDIALLGSQQIIALDSSNLSYDEPNNVLTAGLDKSQIVQLPAVPQG